MTLTDQEVNRLYVAVVYAGPAERVGGWLCDLIWEEGLSTDNDVRWRRGVPRLLRPVLGQATTILLARGIECSRRWSDRYTSTGRLPNSRWLRR